MTQVHLTLAGRWVPCHATQRACPRTFHLANITPQQVEALPVDMLEQLLESLDPPTEVDEVGKAWRDAEGNIHRDHDLPAVIGHDGTRFWYRLDELHRDGDRPAVVYPDGEMHWLQQDTYYRAGGKPNIIHADGSFGDGNAGATQYAGHASD